MKKMFVTFLLTMMFSVGTFLSANAWQCPCQVTKSQLEPPNTTACVGAPEAGDSCNCSAYCN